MKEIKVENRIMWRPTLLSMDVGEEVELNKSHYVLVCRFANRLKSEGKAKYTANTPFYGSVKFTIKRIA